MKKFGLLFSILILASHMTLGQLLLEENFSYTAGTFLTDNSWIQTSTVTTNPILVNSIGLSYTGYLSSNLGLAASLPTSGQDVHKDFSPQTTNGSEIFFSFLANVNSATSTGDYFFHSGNKNGSTGFTAFCSRVWVKSSGSNIVFGVTNGNAGSYGTTLFNLNQTYLFIVKYTLNTSGNDDVRLWVFSTGVPDNETAAGTPEKSETTAGLDRIDVVCLRQGGSASSANVVIDGIRVATSWSQAPLPVELSSFSASVVGNAVKLNWKTETEVNNFGFEIERKVGSLQSTVGNYEKVGFINGNGNSNSPKSYTYEDKNVTAGKYSYRLKQIDNDGQFEYSKSIEVDFGAPKKFELSQNYPNPFNPVTTIRFNLPEAGNVKLTLFNILGQELKTLVNEFKESGVHTINFDATELNSGMYIYKIEAGTFVQIRKMTLVK